MITISLVQFSLLIAILPAYGICLHFLLKRNKSLFKDFSESLKTISKLGGLVNDYENQIASLESTIWNLEEERDMILETLDRAGIKPADLGDEEQPMFSDRNELAIDEEKKDE